MLGCQSEFEAQVISCLFVCFFLWPTVSGHLVPSYNEGILPHNKILVVSQTII